ncbi:MAG: PP2C family protein-serine/threonine phosphatase [Acidobacteriaceae bacterium]|jgi:serine phosphatase RsbU (regulator of sigma subunit)
MERFEAEIERDEALFAKQQVVRLQALLEAGRRIHSTIALDEVLKTVLDIVVRELELSGAFFTHFPHTYGNVPADFLSEQDTMSLSSSSSRARPESDLWTHFPLRDKLGMPFSDLVVIRPPGRTLTFDELDFLQSIAVQSAAAIENARFHERTVRWQRLESDLANARLVQRSLLPQEMPHIEGYAVATRSATCYAVGGDYVDIVPMPSGETMMVVADVAGKGLASALVSTSFRSALHAMVNSGIPLVEIATRMNLLHYNEGEESRRRYVTAFFLQLDPATDSIQVVNAGHNPAFLVSGDRAAGAHQVVRIKASGTPVGMLPFSTYHAEKYSLRHGARLLLYTDGLTEVFRGDEEFGEARLLQSFLDCRSDSSEEVLDSLWSTLNDFSDELEQSDDMTALCLLRQG